MTKYAPTVEGRVPAFARLVNAAYGLSPSDKRPIASEHGGELMSLRTMQSAIVQLLADTMTIRDLYSKHAEQASGPFAGVFKLICHRHRLEQQRLIEILEARVRSLGGQPLVMAADVAAMTSIPSPPRGAELMDIQVERLLNAHERIRQQAVMLMPLAGTGEPRGAERDETLTVVFELIRASKVQVWLLAAYLRHVASDSPCSMREARA